MSRDCSGYLYFMGKVCCRIERWAALWAIWKVLSLLGEISDGRDGGGGGVFAVHYQAQPSSSAPDQDGPHCTRPPLLLWPLLWPLQRGRGSPRRQLTGTCSPDCPYGNVRHYKPSWVLRFIRAFSSCVYLTMFTTVNENKTHLFFFSTFTLSVITPVTYFHLGLSVWPFNKCATLLKPGCPFAGNCFHVFPPPSKHTPRAWALLVLNGGLEDPPGLPASVLEAFPLSPGLPFALTSWSSPHASNALLRLPNTPFSYSVTPGSSILSPSPSQTFTRKGQHPKYCPAPSFELFSCLRSKYLAAEVTYISVIHGIVYSLILAYSGHRFSYYT